MSDLAGAGLYLLGYAGLHSLLAARFVKRAARRLAGPAFAGYRLAYVLLSVVLLLPLLPLLGRLDTTLYRAPPPLSWALHAIQLLSALGFLRTLREVDLGEFLGLHQLRRGGVAREASSDPALDESPELITSGTFARCRHPLYFFASLLLLARPDVSTAWALFTAWAVFYFAVGSVFEERRLLAQFGESYRIYRDRTPRFLPLGSPLRTQRGG